METKSTLVIPQGWDTGRVAGDKEGEWQLTSTELLSRAMKMFWVSKH